MSKIAEFILNSDVGSILAICAVACFYLFGIKFFFQLMATYLF